MPFKCDVCGELEDIYKRFDMKDVCSQKCLDKLIDDAVAAERERIAKLAEELEATYETRSDDPVHGPGTVVEYHTFADAIRELQRC